jgi:hypothetical protein
VTSTAEQLSIAILEWLVARKRVPDIRHWEEMGLVYDVATGTIRAKLWETP